MNTNEKHTRGNGRRGFSMIELMIVITMMGVGILSLAGLYPLAGPRVPAGDLESRANFHARVEVDTPEYSRGEPTSWSETRESGVEVSRSSR